jgi:glycosyltransferase involved in cell wall biosynthesis
MNLLATFLYPDILTYLSAFTESIVNQSVQNFELVVFNDGVIDEGDYFRRLNVPFRIIDVEGDPISIRFQALEFLKEAKSKSVIFQDADDLMSVNRIGECLEYLKEYDLVINDLDLINERGELLQKSIWSERLDNEFVFNFEFIKSLNIVGFGNTAINAKLLTQKIERPFPEIIAADWFIFYQMMEKSNLKGVFINSCKTLYRQHGTNIAGLGTITADRVSQAIRIKKAHYMALNHIGYDFYGELSQMENLTHDNMNINTKTKLPLFWWEETEYLL